MEAIRMPRKKRSEISVPGKKETQGNRRSAGLLAKQSESLLRLPVPTQTVAAEPDPPGSVIQKYRKQCAYTQKELADMMGVTRNTVICWENGKFCPDFALIAPLCNILDMPITELFGVKDKFLVSPGEQSLLDQYRRLSSVGKTVANQVIKTMLAEETIAADKALDEAFTIFELPSTAAAAGTGNEFLCDENDYCFLRKTSRNEKADAIIRVDGHSMEPAYMDGDYVYVEYTPSAREGEDVICRTNDGAVIKRLGHNEIYSVNTDPQYKYPQKFESDRVEIVGRVLGIVSSIDLPTSEEVSALEEVKHRELQQFKKDHRITY